MLGHHDVDWDMREELMKPIVNELKVVQEEYKKILDLFYERKKQCEMELG